MMLGLFITLGTIVVLGILYFKIKKIGQTEIINKINKETLKDVKEAKKRDLKHANDSMSDVSKRLRE